MMIELILCNCPDLQVAERITQHLLQRKLAACVNVLPAVQSHYVWQGKLEHSTEIPLLIKARKEDFIEIEQAICKLHPYQVPEIIAIAGILLSEAITKEKIKWFWLLLSWGMV